MPFDTKLYDILGVDPRSSENDIRSAYLKKSKILHPDKNQNGSSEAMQRLTEAKNILMDRELRALYDSNGLSSVISHMSSTRKSKKDKESETLVELTNSCYQNVYVDHKITLKDMYLGVEGTVSYDVKDFCVICSSGVDFQSNLCDVCLGWGNIQSRYCSKCNGTGRLSCLKCNDTKFIKTTRQKTIQVLNAEDGESIVERAFGNESAGGHSDLVIVINLEPHQIFKKFHNDIVMEMKINLFDALFGFIKVFKHVDDLYYKLICKNDILSHNSFRIVKGLGFKVQKSFTRGNLIIVFKLVMPTKYPDQNSKPYLIASLPEICKKNFCRDHPIVDIVPLPTSD